MTRIVTVVVVIYILVQGLYSCKKPGADPVAIVYLDQALKNYYDWQEGSYWVYKDSLTGDVDSFVVSKYYYDEGINAKDYNVQKVNIIINEYPVNRPVTRSNSNVLLWTLQRNSAALDYRFHPDSFEKALTLSFGPIPFIIEDSIYYYQGPPCISDTSYYGTHKLATLNVGTTQFNEVFEKYYRRSSIECYDLIPQDDTYFINQDAGLVKMRLNNYVNRNWELLYYHINR